MTRPETGIVAYRPSTSTPKAGRRQEAERDRLTAIAFALQGDPCDYDADAEILTLNVGVTPAS